MKNAGYKFYFNRKKMFFSISMLAPINWMLRIKELVPFPTGWMIIPQKIAITTKPCPLVSLWVFIAMPVP